MAYLIYVLTHTHTYKHTQTYQILHQSETYMAISNQSFSRDSEGRNCQLKQVTIPTCSQNQGELENLSQV
jgi:hypothetical protein